MAKKDFSKSITGVDAFFSAAQPAETIEPEDINEPVKTHAVTPVDTVATVPMTIEPDPTTPAKHGRATYIFTLHLPKEWKNILADTAWERRTSVTGLLVEIIGDWLKAHKKI